MTYLLNYLVWVVALVASFALWMFGLSTLGVPTAYKDFIPRALEVGAGETLEVWTTYAKRWDCGGEFFVRLVVNETPYTLHTGRLGDREPGEWTILRRYTIPLGIPSGAAKVQEVLIYDCDWGQFTVHSPWAHFKVT